VSAMEDRGEREGFERFGGDLVAAAPPLADRLARDGVPLVPDLEIPVVWVGHLGTSLLGCLDELDDTERSAAFAVVERGLVNDSELLRTAVATGLLEVLASAVSGGRLDGARLAALLGPESRAYLDAWDAFTLGNSSLGGYARPPQATPPQAPPPEPPRRWWRVRRRSAR
jgi:hypothetical protein